MMQTIHEYDTAHNVLYYDRGFTVKFLIINSVGEMKRVLSDPELYYQFYEINCSDFLFQIFGAWGYPRFGTCNGLADLRLVLRYFK